MQRVGGCGIVLVLGTFVGSSRELRKTSRESCVEKIVLGCNYVEILSDSTQVVAVLSTSPRCDFDVIFIRAKVISRSRTFAGSGRVDLTVCRRIGESCVQKIDFEM